MLRETRNKGLGVRLHGFTLVELIVVIVIMMIAAAMVIPQVVSTGDVKSRSAARMLMADLEYAQSQAIVTQNQVTVTFDTSGNAYTVSNASGTLTHPITKNAYVIDLDQTNGMEGVSIDTVNFGSGQSVTFDALGAPDYDGSVTFVAGAQSYVISVAPITGRVTVSEGS